VSTYCDVQLSLMPVEPDLFVDLQICAPHALGVLLGICIRQVPESVGFAFLHDFYILDTSIPWKECQGVCIVLVVPHFWCATGLC
jgi:hypothetical protein